MAKKRLENSGNSDNRNYFFLVLFLATVYVAFLIVKPFISAILMSMVLSYILYPLYRKINKKVKRETISALLVALIIIIAITVPTVLIVNKLTKEAQLFYVTTKQKFTGLSIDQCEDDSFTCSIVNRIKFSLESPEFKFSMNTIFTKLSNFIIEKGSAMIISIPAVILNMFIAIFATFYLIRDGPQLISKVKEILPLKKKDKKFVVEKFNDMTHAIIYSQIFVAVIQGGLAGLAFWIVGIKAPLIWTLIMVFLSLIPMIGSSIVWFPASLYLIIAGYTTSDYFLLWKGVGLLIYGVLIVSTADNILKPKLIGDKTNVHPILVLIGVLGGLSLFGFIGFIIGPLVLALLMMFLKIYQREKNEVQS